MPAKTLGSTVATRMEATQRPVLRYSVNALDPSDCLSLLNCVQSGLGISPIVLGEIADAAHAHSGLPGDSSVPSGRDECFLRHRCRADRAAALLDKAWCAPHPRAMADAPTDTRVELIVVGGGLVGLTLALACAEAGIEVAVIDREDPATMLAEPFDGRTTAIAHGSQQVLAGLLAGPLGGAPGDALLASRRAPAG